MTELPEGLMLPEDVAYACNDDTAMTATTCRLFIERYARSIRRPFSYLDLIDEAQSLGLKYAYGTLRNKMAWLVAEGKIAKFLLENPARFMWKQYAEKDSQWKRWVRSDKTPTRGGCHRVWKGGTGGGVLPRTMQVDFEKFMLSLDWQALCYVHNVKIEFDVAHPVGVSAESGWQWSPNSHSWLKEFDCLEFPLTVQFYDTGHVQVAVRCSLKPIPFHYDGLMRLTSVLGELKGLLQ